MSKPSVYILLDINKGRTFGVFPTYAMAWAARENACEVVVEHGPPSDEICLGMYLAFQASRMGVDEFAKHNKLLPIYCVEILARGMDVNARNWPM